MTSFEQQFISKCLTSLNHILSHEEALDEAIENFAFNDRENPRYQLNTKIADAIYWDLPEILNFSAAYAETLFQVMNSFHHEKTISIENLNTARELFESKYINRITGNTKPQQRIQSVVENISRIKTDEFAMRTESNEPTINPFSFFFTREAVGLIATTTVAAAAFYLAAQKS